MKTRNEYIEILKSYKSSKADEYGICRIGIFGSVARNEHDENSDVDVCVELLYPSLFYLVHIKEDLQKLFGVSVDIIRIKPKMDLLLEKDIMRDCIYA